MRALRLAAGTSQLFCELLQGHKVFESLFDRETKILSDESTIDVLFVSLDHGVGIRLRQRDKAWSAHG